MPRKRSNARFLRRRNRPRRRFNRKPRLNYASNTMRIKNIASIVEVSAQFPILANTDYNFSTAPMAATGTQFQRIRALALHFKYYRITEVIWRFVPLYNVFQSDAASNAPSLPTYQRVMNRSGDLTVWGQAQYENQGATNIEFKKTIIIRYKPNLVQVLLGGPQVASPAAVNYQIGTRPIFNQWIATNTFQLDANEPVGGITRTNYPVVTYQGHSMLFSRLVGGAGPTDHSPIGNYEVSVRCEFKDPHTIPAGPQ